MKAVGITAEYNPFHFGHKYHIEEAKKRANADVCVVAMSGDFVQRGEPAFFEKQFRTKCAVDNGADIVLELPVCYSLASAEYFALGAVKLLSELKVSSVAFGAENEDVSLLSEIADYLIEEPSEYKMLLNEALKSGDSFPTARCKALDACLSQKASTILKGSNNILGVEYIKALRKINSAASPIAIQRIGSGYLNEELSSEFSSSMAIRKAILDSGINGASDSIPEETFYNMQKYLSEYIPLVSEDFAQLLQYRILFQTEDFSSYFDISDSLARSISSLFDIRRKMSFDEMIMSVKSKNLTYSRISRCLMHILLGITEADVSEYINNEIIGYGRILGMSPAGQKYLHEIKKDLTIPVRSNLSDLFNEVSKPFQKMLQTDYRAFRIYNLIHSGKSGKAFEDELKIPVYIKN